METLVQRSIDDNTFVSIDLSDENKCEICNQMTNEQIFPVVLNDEFTLFEGSHSKHFGHVTMAHQFCLKKWAEIIERNLKTAKKNACLSQQYEKSICSQNNFYKKKESIQIINKEIENRLHNQSQVVKNPNNLKPQNTDEYLTNEFKSKKYWNKYKKDLMLMSCTELKDFHEELACLVKESSNMLVNHLQLRDKLTQEIACQYYLISQLVNLRKTSFY